MEDGHGAPEPIDFLKLYGISHLTDTDVYPKGPWSPIPLAAAQSIPEWSEKLEEYLGSARRQAAIAAKLSGDSTPTEIVLLQQEVLDLKDKIAKLVPYRDMIEKRREFLGDE